MNAPPSTALLRTLPPAATGGTLAAAVRRRRTRRVLVAALLISVAVHVALTLVPADLPTTPDETPLKVAITELPPPPTAAPAPPPKPKPKRVAPKPAAPPPPIAQPEPAPAEVEAPAAPVAEAAPVPEAPAGPEGAATAEAPAAPAPAEAVAAAPAATEPPPRQLPPRVDLDYKVFLGTQGFLIGEATYRFEHTGDQYQIATVGEARGLAALLIRGQGRVESRGRITANGLQPSEFAIERGSKDRREVATFDWPSLQVTLHDQKTEPLELPTYDPLALMWQFYFSPPVEDQQSFNVATTRRVFRYTITREATEKIEWVNGEIETERWHRRSLDGKTDGYVWLAPSLHYIPVKMRLVATNRGTLEALLASIRVDEPVARQ